MEEFVPIIVGLALVLVGVFQYAQERDKQADAKREELFAQLEKTMLQNVALTAKVIRWKGLAHRERTLKLEARAVAKRYKARYSKVLAAYKKVK